MYRGNGRKIVSPRDGEMTPFKIADNLYFCGTYQASSHLIDTGDGLIMIDTGYGNTFEMVVEAVEKLGFEPEEIKYIINTHWHGDHAEASGKMAELTGAKNIISRIDAPEVERRGYFKPDMLIDDGDILSLGNITIEFMVTPGHTKGTLSFFFDTTIDGKTYRVGSFGGAGANTLVRTHPSFYESCRKDYLASVDRLLVENVDIFIGNHVWNNDTERKGKHLLETGENLFLDAAEWRKFLNFCRDRCLSLPSLI